MPTVFVSPLGTEFFAIGVGADGGDGAGEGDSTVEASAGFCVSTTGLTLPVKRSIFASRAWISPLKLSPSSARAGLFDWLDETSDSVTIIGVSGAATVGELSAGVELGAVGGETLIGKFPSLTVVVSNTFGSGTAVVLSWAFASSTVG